MLVRDSKEIILNSHLVYYLESTWNNIIQLGCMYLICIWLSLFNLSFHKMNIISKFQFIFKTAELCWLFPGWNPVGISMLNLNRMIRWILWLDKWVLQVKKWQTSQPCKMHNSHEDFFPNFSFNEMGNSRKYKRFVWPAYWFVIINFQSK